MPTLPVLCMFIFFFNDTATTEIYTLSLHDALPISSRRRHTRCLSDWSSDVCSSDLSELQSLRHLVCRLLLGVQTDRKSTRLNSSHLGISYAVFCLKKTTGRETMHAIHSPRHRRL